jgi:hypothetical protein
VWAQGTQVGAGGSAEVKVGAEASGSAEGSASIGFGGFEAVGVSGSASGEAHHTTGAKAQGEVTAGLDGVKAAGDIGASSSVGASGEIAGSATVLGASVGGHLSGGAEVVGTVNAGGEIGAGMGTLGASGSAEAFLGAKASVGGGITSGLLGVDIFSTNLEASGAAGFGGGVGATLYVKDGVLIVGGEALASLGIGGGLEAEVRIDLLAPFRMAAKMLEANGVMSSDLNQLVPTIIGYSTGALDIRERTDGKEDPKVDVGGGETASPRARVRRRPPPRRPRRWRVLPGRVRSDVAREVPGGVGRGGRLCEVPRGVGRGGRLREVPGGVGRGGCAREVPRGVGRGGRGADVRRRGADPDGGARLELRPRRRRRSPRRRGRPATSRRPRRPRCRRPAASSTRSPARST